LTDEGEYLMGFRGVEVDFRGGFLVVAMLFIIQMLFIIEQRMSVIKVIGMVL
jgi:hypothetical protein